MHSYLTIYPKFICKHELQDYLATKSRLFLDCMIVTAMHWYYGYLIMRSFFMDNKKIDINVLKVKSNYV